MARRARLTGFSRFIITMFIFGILITGVVWMGNNTKSGRKIRLELTDQLTDRHLLGKKVTIDGESYTITRCDRVECTLSNGTPIARTLLSKLKLED